jgi:hypothetical protein
MVEKADLGRRGLLGALLLGVGGIGGWVARKFQSPSQIRKPAPTALDSRFVYDISKYETTSPELLLYNPGDHIKTGFERAKRIAAMPGGKFAVAGDRAVKIFTAAGVEQSEFPIKGAPHCMLVAGKGGDADEIIIGTAKNFTVYDFNGKEKWDSGELPRRTYLTSIAANDDTLFLADGGNRKVLICDRKTGKVRDQFGEKDDEKNNPGFSVPSPYFDLTVAADGNLRVVNPGRLRVETYSPDGHFQSSWGGPGMKIDRFCGCCNPVYFTMMPNGDFITSEKGLTRVNIYNSQGEFKGAVAGPDILVDDKEIAKQACADCSVGAGFDVAIEQSGRILVLDPFRMVVRPFTPKTGVEASTTTTTA